MAKVAFTKLGLKKKDTINTFTFNDLEIEVKIYLPIEEKIDLITNVLNNSIDAVNHFVNPLKVEVFFNLGLIDKYTNINFTDKQKEDPAKLYDLFEENGFITELVKCIPEDEYNTLYDWTKATIDEYSKYKNSAMGILEAASANYSNTNFDISQIQDKLNNLSNLDTLNSIMENLG